MKSVILLVLVVVVLTFGCCGVTGGVTPSGGHPSPNATSATGGPSVNPSQGQASSNQQEQSANIEDGQIGQTYTVNYEQSEYEVTLENTSFVYDPTFSENYLLAYFEIKNVGSTSEYFVPNIYAVDKTSEKYDSTIPLLDNPKYSKILNLATELPPNTKTSGWTGFSIPQGNNTYHIYFEYTNPFLTSTPNYIKYTVVKGSG